MEHCEPWVTGVIYIGGAGVALGYFNDPTRTSKQFIIHPRTGEYLFRTGDLGRLRPGTNGISLLEILGREDTQVKVNGYRIELGEIEKLAMEDNRVLNCCAVVSESRSTPQLVLFVTRDQLLPATEKSTADVKIVKKWEDVYDTVYESSANEGKFAGWSSSFDGNRIPFDEMQEWLNCTLESIRGVIAFMKNV